MESVTAIEHFWKQEEEVLKYDRTRPTIKKDLERKTYKNPELISQIAPKLAEEGLIVAFDHMEIKNMKKLVEITLQDGSEIILACYWRSHHHTKYAESEKSKLGGRCGLCAP